MASPTFVDYASYLVNTGPSVTAALADLVGELDDDILTFTLYIEFTGAVTVPSGWTEITSGTQTGPTPDFKGYAWEHRLRPGDPTSWTWSWTGNRYAGAKFAAWRGCVATGSPIDGSSFLASASSSTSCTATGITTTTADTRIVFHGMNFDGVLATPPSGMTEHNDGNNIELASVAQAAAGATGDKTATLASASWNAGILFALASVGPAAGVVAAELMQVMQPRRVRPRMVAY